MRKSLRNRMPTPTIYPDYSDSYDSSDRSDDETKNDFANRHESRTSKQENDYDDGARTTFQENDDFKGGLGPNRSHLVKSFIGQTPFTGR